MITYFPPITGTYLRLSRFLIALLTYLMTPTFLLLMQRPEWIPAGFEFIMVKDPTNLPLVWQFLILELAIDGLRLAAVNTPNMLSTPLSVMAALILGEFSVKSGWFNAEVMLYMAFVAIANYTHPSYELGYAVKFFRLINLILTAIFQFWGVPCRCHPVLCRHRHQQDGIWPELSLSAHSVSLAEAQPCTVPPPAAEVCGIK